MKLCDETFAKLQNEKCTLREALNLPESICEVIYNSAHQKYSQGQYEESIPLFRILCLLENHNFKYVYALAAAMHMYQDFQSAAKCYIFASHLDITNPMPNFYAAECYIQMQDYLSAGISLGIILANDKIDAQKYSAIKEKAAMINQAVQEKIKAQVDALVKEHEKTAK